MRSLLVSMMLLSLLLCSCSKTSRIELDGVAQGTYYHIVYYSNNNVDYQNKIDSILHDFDMSLSVYNPNSLVSRINAGDTTVVADKYLIDNLKLSKEVYEQSLGAFDVTGKPLFDYWGFGEDGKWGRRDEVDLSRDRHSVDSICHYVGFDKIAFDTLTGKVSLPEGMQLNFNAIAQGYSVGVISDYLTSEGLDSYIIDIGGEIYAMGRRGDGKQWQVGIEKPADSSEGERVVQEVISAEDIAVVTSGSYRKYYEVDSIKYSHVIDPRTGFPVHHNLLSVTVIHKDPALADAWATTFMVLGEEQSRLFLETHPEMECVFISETSGQKK